MRVAIFFDGKNFHSGWKKITRCVPIDFVKLSQWLITQVDGSRLWGAYYYTGVETKTSEGNDANQRLVLFLKDLERLPGFFVYQFPRQSCQRRCKTCGDTISYSREKEVDTTMVADMFRLAAVNAFDVAILISGDGDHAPAVEGVRALGKQVYVATWKTHGLSPRTRNAAYDHIDLHQGLNEFRMDSDKKQLSMGVDPQLSKLTITPAATDGELAEETVFLAELDRASKLLSGGYVGLSYFLRQWKSSQFVTDVQRRHQILKRLVKKGIVEIYQVTEDEKGLRRKADSKSDVVADASPR